MLMIMMIAAYYLLIPYYVPGTWLSKAMWTFVALLCDFIYGEWNPLEVHGLNSKIQAEFQALLTTVLSALVQWTTCIAIHGGPVVKWHL